MVGSTDSSAAGLRVEETGQEPSHRPNRRRGRSSPGTGLLSGPSTPSPEGLKEERENCKCIAYCFVLNLLFFLANALLLLNADVL